MNFSVISEVVSKYAPLLGSVIKDSNPIAGLIIMAIAKAFNSSTDPNELLNSLSNDANAQVKLKQIELEHQEVLLKSQIEDRENAREREEKIIQLTGKRDWVLDFIAIIVTVGFFSLCMINYFSKIANDHILVMLSSGFMLCLSYYFGSSNK